MIKDTETLTYEMLQEVIDSVTPYYRVSVLDEYVQKGIPTENLMLIGNIPAFKNLKQIKTQHGKLTVNYNRFIPIGNCYIMNVADVEKEMNKNLENTLLRWEDWRSNHD